MSLSLQNLKSNQPAPESRNPEVSYARPSQNLDHVDMNQASIPKLNQLNPASQKIDLGNVDIAQAILPKASSNANPESPTLATVGQQINEDIAKLWREKKSDGGFVKLAKTIGKFIKELFTK